MINLEPGHEGGCPTTPRNTIWADRLRHHELHVEEAGRLVVEGALKRIVGLTLEAVGCEAAVGSYCEVTRPDGGRVEAEVVGFSGERIFLMPTGQIRGVISNSRVTPKIHAASVFVGDALFGRVLDGAGKPIDGKGPTRCHDRIDLHATPINPLQRQPIVEL